MGDIQLAIEVTLKDRMGSDLSVVNAARVSFDKESEWDKGFSGEICEGLLSRGDKRLIAYLAKHNHWSPFGHASMQFRIKAPVFVARQLVKHQIGLTWNEVSRRYVSDDPSIYYPVTWRAAAARMILPQSMFTEWYWSGTLYAFARVCNLRCKPDAQIETQIVADEIDKIAKELFPVSWEQLRK